MFNHEDTKGAKKEKRKYSSVLVLLRALRVFVVNDIFFPHTVTFNGTRR
ncbi:hypothetical protein MTBUT4_400002 [Magnetospirillum sp. UT-4]|nr:hypothetical protein MTBUT4_400002 [Magnetospirillum sp. UT-4]